MSKKRKHEAIPDAQEKVDKKKRTYTEDARRRASIYERLADESNDVRIQAAQDLICNLEPQNLTDKSKDIENALRRLIRGLCSGRKAARFGFFVALTELLRVLYGKQSKYDADDVPSLGQTLETIEALTHLEGSASGQVSSASSLQKQNPLSRGRRKETISSGGFPPTRLLFSRLFCMNPALD